MTGTARIQKVLANAGIASRRQIESWIDEGRIRVNGHPATPGQPISSRDQVELDGKPLRFSAPATQRVLIYNKPVGQICSRSDPQGRDTVFAHLPDLTDGRWVGVGRLDINTSGLLLLTTDGQLASALMHPRNGLLREYRARILGGLSETGLQRLRDGIRLEDGMARFEHIMPAGGSGANRWYVCRLREGRNREVRRLFEAVGGQVNRLIRTGFGPVSLPRDLAPGQSRRLPTGQLHKLHEAAGITSVARRKTRR